LEFGPKNKIKKLESIKCFKRGGEGGGGGHKKTLKNCNIKMQQNTKIEDPLPDFLTTPCTPSKEFENDCASMFLTELQLQIC
jgi:hypothetical protein